MQWLMLVHQVPPKPDYLRVKTGRRLARIGALAIKNTVYVLPSTEQTLEDLQWTVREIRDSGGEAHLFESRLVDGLTDAELRQRFHAAREADYAPLVKDARALLARIRRGRGLDEATRALAKLRAAFDAIAAIDFFESPAGQTAATLLDSAARELQRDSDSDSGDAAEYSGRVWVTRAGVHIDRIASAWLIHRFVDPAATFRFARGKTDGPRTGEIGFDLFDAEFTHRDGLCTFEVLAARFRPGDRALRLVAEVVHDIDLKETKYERAETAGVAAVIDGIARAHKDDDERLRRGAEVFEGLYGAARKGR